MVVLRTDFNFAVLLEIPSHADDFLRSLLHIDDQPIDAGHEEVIGNVDRYRDHETGRGRKQRDLNASGDQCRVHVTRGLNGGEGEDHSRHRAQEAHERGDIGNGRQNHQPSLEEAEFDGPSGRDCRLELPCVEATALESTQPSEQDR